MKNSGCAAAKGMCGKTNEVANLQDLLLHACKGIGFWAARSEERGVYDESTAFFVTKCLFATITNANFSADYFVANILAAVARRDKIRAGAGGSTGAALPDAAVFTAADSSEVKALAAADKGGWLEIANEDIRSLRSLILYGLKGIAAYVEHAYALGKSSRKVFSFMLNALGRLTDDTMSADALTALVLETGAIGVEAMALLDGANTGTYGSPRITTVKTGVRGRPGILVSGHDLRDLHDLLEQTKGTGVDVYTHGEMLPAHYYPYFEKYDNLYGNYGGSWWSQGSEIDKFHGPVLFTSNCIVPPRDGQKPRIFTTGVVGFDGCVHIGDREEGGMKDFSALIALAKTCPPPEALEDGTIVGGFGHDQVFALADKVVAAVKSGAIKRFVVMAGCDGRQPIRSYYTDVASELQQGTVILTAGCAKYRYNKLGLGDIGGIGPSGLCREEGIDVPAIAGGGIPRVLDAGQCNDSYSLALIAIKLKEAFGLADVNDLPLSFDIAWYEQKAVLVLLALLSLGFKKIRLGPTLPGFLSPGVAGILVEKFGIMGIGDVKTDVAAMMGGK
jgi:hydroxylamine reductase